MKKALLILLLTVVLTGCDGLTDLHSFPLAEPIAEYELDTWGYNSEVYEFTPKSNSNYVCVMLMLDSGEDMGFQCFPKGERNELEHSK